MENETRSLTSRQRAMLEFERTWWQSDEPRAELIATRFGCSTDQYADELAQVLALPAALAHDPMVVRRHMRRRSRRRSELRAAVTAPARDDTMHGDEGVVHQA